MHPRDHDEKRTIVLTSIFLLLSIAALILGWFSIPHLFHSNEQKAKITALSRQYAIIDFNTFLSKEPDPASLLDEKIEQMTLEEKVGQLFIARCPDEAAAEKARQYHLGGYILFADDFDDKTKETIQQEIQSYQDLADIPLFIGVDEEGGIVNRISIHPLLRAVPFWSPQDLYAEGGLELIRSDTEEKCQLLQSLGINLNFAPVCDLSSDPDDFIYPRTFGKDAQAISEYVQTVVEVMNQNQIGSVLKHFPGYGNNADTHTGLVYDHRSYDTFVSNDFLPFAAGIQSGSGMVLVSHTIVCCIDADAPASLSSRVHQILRQDLAFDGVIITDDLAMAGVKKYCTEEEIAVRAILAGNDLLCCTDFEEQIKYVLAAVEDGTISEAQIDASLRRILNYKIQLGIYSLNS